MNLINKWSLVLPYREACLAAYTYYDFQWEHEKQKLWPFHSSLNWDWHTCVTVKSIFFGTRLSSNPTAICFHIYLFYPVLCPRGRPVWISSGYIPHQRSVFYRWTSLYSLANTLFTSVRFGQVTRPLWVSSCHLCWGRSWDLGYKGDS